MYFVTGGLSENNPGADMRNKHGRSSALLNTTDGKQVRGAHKRGEIPDNLVEIIKNTDHRFYVIEDLFQDDLAEKLRPLNPYFISDIRTGSSETIEDIDILWNSALMYNWIKILQPAKFMIKFRCPWTITDNSIKRLNTMIKPYMNETFAKCDIPMVENYNKKEFHFLRPDRIYMQAFAPKQSAETRLVGSTLIVEKFDVTEYEEKLASFNQTYRCTQTQDMPKIPVRGITPYHDGYLALDIFNNYIAKYNVSAKPSDMFNRLLKMIRRRI